MLVLHNVRMEQSNVRRKKKKEITKYDKNIVKCDVGTAQYEGEIVKCEKKRELSNVTKELSHMIL